MDFVNALFELGGGVFVWFSIFRLLKDRAVAGVSAFSMGFFAVWGYWNLLYYPTLEQWWSLVGAALVAVSNTIYVALIIRQRRRSSA